PCLADVVPPTTHAARNGAPASRTGLSDLHAGRSHELVLNLLYRRAAPRHVSRIQTETRQHHSGRFAEMAYETCTIVLAAGEGRRLARLTGGIPKQFWRPPGERTLLEGTVDRFAPLAARTRRALVIAS